MGLYLSDRQKWITQSEIRNMTQECKRVGGINLAQGVCDTPVAQPVREGACRAINGGVNVYTRYDGLQELREAIARRHMKRTGIQVNPEKQIVVSSGTTGAFYSTALALLNPGDEVIVFEPYYSYHISTLKAVEVKPVFVRMHPPSWNLVSAEIEGAISSRTRGIIVNTPANPAGKVFASEELEMIARIANTYDLFVFTDEIYEHFVYDGLRHISPVVMEGMSGRTITMSGFSKIFSITGWRIGYCICDEKWAGSIGHINDLVYVCAPAPLQMGVISGLEELDESYYEAIIQEYQPRRDKFCASLQGAGFEPYIPQGAYYVLADINSVPGENSKEKTMEFLRKTGVAGVPGQAFYHDGEGGSLARFCFAKEDALIDEACRRIERFSWDVRD